MDTGQKAAKLAAIAIINELLYRTRGEGYRILYRIRLQLGKTGTIGHCSNGSHSAEVKAESK